MKKMKNKWISGVVLLPILLSGAYLQTNSNSNNSDLNKNLKAIQGSTIEQTALGTWQTNNYGGAIVNDGANDILYTWGSNNHGQLGNGTATNQAIPVAIDVNGSGSAFDEGQLSNLTFGTGSSGVVANNGTADTAIYTWGFNDHGQVGRGTLTNNPLPGDLGFTYNPENGPLTVKTLDFNGLTSTMIVSDGQTDAFYSWGTNNYGQAGNGTIGADNLTPTLGFETSVGQTIDLFSNNSTHMQMTVTNPSGTTNLLVWGENDRGQLGDNSFNEYQLNPELIAIGESNYDQQGITAFSGDAWTSGIVKNDEIYTTGSNSFGQLGIGTQTSSRIYEKIETPTGNVTSLNMRFDQSSSAVIDNQLYTWGNNNYGQLGLGDLDLRTTATLVDTTGIDGTITGLTTGGSSLLITVYDGTDFIVYGAGENNTNELGISTDTVNHSFLTETEIRTNN